jgi:alpha-D-ribose 1-methylphosphonate 5-phosphate C-P lyase
MNIEDYKEVGGRCDMWFTCDHCGARDYSWDEETEESSSVRMFEVGDKDYCEWCLQHLIDEGRLP